MTTNYQITAIDSSVFDEKHGFKHIATHPNTTKINGITHDDRFYCLQIAPTDSA